MAYMLGASLTTDAYALVMLIPSLSMALLVQAVRSAFLTLYPLELKQGEKQGMALANRFLLDLTSASLIVAFVAFGVAWSLWPYLKQFANSALIDASRPLLAPAAGLVLAAAIVAALTAVLNALGRFSGPQSTSVLPTLVVVAAVAWWGRSSGASGACWRVVGWNVGASRSLTWNAVAVGPSISI